MRSLGVLFASIDTARVWEKVEVQRWSALPRDPCRADHVQHRVVTAFSLEGDVGTGGRGQGKEGKQCPARYLSERRRCSDGVEARAAVEVQVRPPHAQTLNTTALRESAEIKRDARGVGIVWLTRWPLGTRWAR